MTVDRRVYVKKHIAALAITLVIFTIGVLIGLKVSDTRILEITNTARIQRAQFESLQLQYNFINSAQNASCFAFKTALDQNVYDLENARLSLEGYIQEDQKKEEFSIAKREYMITEMRYWLLAKQTKKVCGSDAVSILFFYRPSQVCSDCGTQGIILTYLKNKFKEKLLIFSLDADVEDPLIATLKNTYNITQTPSMVIEENMLEGLTKKEEIIKEICKSFKGSIPECQE